MQGSKQQINTKCFISKLFNALMHAIRFPLLGRGKTTALGFDENR